MKLLYAAFVFLCCLLVFTQAKEIQLTKCESEEIATIKSLNVDQCLDDESPDCVLKIGSTVVITMLVLVKECINDTNINIYVKMGSMLMKYKTFKAAEFTSLPMCPGRIHTIMVSMTVPYFVKPNTYNLKADAVDGNKKISCYSFQLTFKK